MMFKVEGSLGSLGTPKWTDYFCSRFCLQNEGWEIADADYLDKDDLRPHMKCVHCGGVLLDDLSASGGISDAP